MYFSKTVQSGINVKLAFAKGKFVLQNIKLPLVSISQTLINIDLLENNAAIFNARYSVQHFNFQIQLFCDARLCQCMTALLANYCDGYNHKIWFHYWEHFSCRIEVKEAGAQTPNKVLMKSLQINYNKQN